MLERNRDRGLRVEVGIRSLDLVEPQAALVLALDEDHVLEVGQVLARLEDLREEVRLGDEDPRLGVRADVLDLLGGVRHVDRERRGADGDRREVGEVELGTVGQQQRDALAALQPEPDEAAGEGVDALAHLGPRDRDLVALRAHEDVVRARRGGNPERLGERARVDRPACSGARLHPSPPPESFDCHEAY